MIRKILLLAAAALAVLAVSASSAGAEVEVEVDNPGMFNITGDGMALIAHTGFGEVVVAQCDVNWEFEVDSAGHIDFTDVEFDPPGTGPCSTLNDCDDAGWEGQISEERPVHVTFCLEGTGGSDITGEVTCEMGNNMLEVRCEDADVEESNSGVPLEMDGELTLDEALEIEYSEAFFMAGGLPADNLALDWNHNNGADKVATFTNTTGTEIYTGTPWINGGGGRFTIQASTCTGVMLAAGGTCTVTVRRANGSNEMWGATLYVEYARWYLYYLPWWPSEGSINLRF